MATMKDVDKYINAIKNKEKKRYAIAYKNALIGKGEIPDSATYSLSHMAAQGVQLHLTKMFE